MTEVIQDIDIASPGVPSLILRDLSEYATLPFMAAFDVPSSSTKPQKRVSYIALSKKTMPQLVDLFLKFKANPEIYTNGTLEAILSVSCIRPLFGERWAKRHSIGVLDPYQAEVRLSSPIEIWERPSLVENRYDGVPGNRPRVCPAAQKFGRRYVAASMSSSTVLTTVARNIRRSDRGNLETGSRGLQGWYSRRLVRSASHFIALTHRTNPLLYSSAALSFPLETQQSEENFDLALIASLEIDVVPYLGDSRVSDYLILQLGKTLHSGSQLQQPEDDHDTEVKTPNGTAPDVSKSKSNNGKKSSNQSSNATEVEMGTTRTGKVVPRERFSYWCFDLLFLICSDVAKGMAGYGSDLPFAKHKQTGSQIGDGSPRYAFLYFSVDVDPR